MTDQRLVAQVLDQLADYAADDAYDGQLHAQHGCGTRVNDDGGCPERVQLLADADAIEAGREP